MTTRIADFLDKRSLPDPVGLSSTARIHLAVPAKSVRYGIAGQGVVHLNSEHRPSDVLTRRRKVVCPVCSLDPDRPVMIEEGEQWEFHQRTKSHQRLARREIVTKEVQDYVRDM